MNLAGRLLNLCAVLGILAQSSCASESSESQKSAATDYSQAAHWLSLPAPIQTVDVFYFYPTVWKSSDNRVPQICDIDNASMLKNAPAWFARQATAFEPFANIYAPYYRQDNGSPVDRLAVISGIPTTDGIAAFDYYIKHYNNGRPFILAAHSQGSNVVANLLSRYLKDNPDVLKRMIVAYVIGYPITATYLAGNPHLKFAQSPDDTGVIVSYNTEAPNVVPSTNPVLYGSVGLVINPITWTTSETLATTAQGLGSLMPNAEGAYVPVAQYCDAKVDTANGVLLCSTADEEALAPFDAAFPLGVYHALDYSLYYFNLRANAQNRIEKYLGISPSDAGTDTGP